MTVKSEKLYVEHINILQSKIRILQESNKNLIEENNSIRLKNVNLEALTDRLTRDAQKKDK